MCVCIGCKRENSNEDIFTQSYTSFFFQFVITIQVEFIHCYRLKLQKHFISMHKHTQNTSKILCVFARYCKDDLYILIFQFLNM